MAAPTPIPGQTDLTLSPDADATSLPGNEILPDVVAGANGGFLALWYDELPANAGVAPVGYPAGHGFDADLGRTVMLRAFDADGAPIGLARPVTADLTGDAVGAGMVALGNGNVAVGWNVLIGTSSRIGMLIADAATGATIGPEIVVATAATADYDLTLQQMVALSGGRTGVVYIDGAGAGADLLKLAIFEADGSPGAVATLLTAGPRFIAARGVADRVTALTGVNADVLALVTEVESGPREGETEIVFRNLDGTAAALPTVNLGELRGVPPNIVALPGGGYAISYPVAGTVPLGDPTTLMVRRYDATGTLAGTPTEIVFPYNNVFRQSELLALPDGGLVVAMPGLVPGGPSQTDIFAQRIAADGSLDGGVVLVNTVPGGDQSQVALALTTNHDLIAAWADSRPPETDIHAARLDVGDFPMTLIGTNGPDTLVGNTGADLIIGRGGDDLLSGLGGHDTLLGGDGADTLLGGAGNDQFRGGAGDDVLDGGEGNDTLLGQGGADSLLGGDGADVLRGDAGADTLVGGGGADRLLGGTEADVFQWWSLADSPYATPDRILDFAPGDRIDLSAIDADTTSSFDNAFAFIGGAAFTGGPGIGEVRYVTTATATVVLVDGDDADGVADMRIMLAGVHVLTAADFIL